MAQSPAIAAFVAKMNEFNTKQDAAVAGLQGDIDSLNAQIKALNDSAGQITPEDQALLDDIQAKAQSVSDKLDAMDALTPPVVPPAP